jgi:hypothetical protein
MYVYGGHRLKSFKKKLSEIFCFVFRTDQTENTFLRVSLLFAKIRSTAIRSTLMLRFSHNMSAGDARRQWSWCEVMI